MFKQIQLEPENNTFSEIMGNGKVYTIPAFQRDYSWEEEQLSELWEDIENMLANKIQHFMGYVVLESQDGKNFKVIDGQQRLTSLLMLTIAVLYQLKVLIDQGIDEENNAVRIKQIHDTYLGVFNTVTLTTSPKLTLNRNNKNHFKEIIDNEYDVPRMHGITATNRKLNRALQFFQKKTTAYRSGEALAQLLQDVVDELVFTSITVQDELNAYIVFETLNARGVHLSSPDLLKNYLLSVFAKNASSRQLEEIEIDWSKIIEQLGETNFTAFLRSYHGIQDRLRHKKDLYRFIKEKIELPDQVVTYIRSIKKFAPVYSALQNPDSAFWKNYGEGQYLSCVSFLKTLNLFNIKTPLSLLMVAYDRLTPTDFKKVLMWVEVIAMRYNVICNKGAKEQESLYNQLAIKIFKGEINPSGIKSELMEVYPTDHEFMAAFSTKSMPSRRSPKKVSFILRKVEAHLSGGQEPAENLTLEHVLPYSPSDEWQAAFGRESYTEALERLGNMALLTEAQNHEVGQGRFDVKAELLRSTHLQINHKIAEYPDWNMDSLNSYQSWLAKQAKAIWKIS